MKIAINPAMSGQLDAFLDLGIARFVIEPTTLPREAITEVFHAAGKATTVAQLLSALPQVTPPIKTRALMWLAKMGLLILST